MMPVPRCPKKPPARIGDAIRKLGRLWATSEESPYIEPATKTAWNSLLREWSDDSSIPLLVRRNSTVCGSLVGHISGRKVVPSDDSPAQWACGLAFCGKVPTLREIRDGFAKDAIPGGFAHKVRQKGRHDRHDTLGSHSIIRAGWKLCHIRPVVLGTCSSLQQANITDLKEAFFRFLSPSNYFLLPKKWAGIGETADFIAGFLEGIQTRADHTDAPVLQESTQEKAQAPKRLPTSEEVRSAIPPDCAAGYFTYRLAFDAAVIERLKPKDKFCVVTENGIYAMTKRQFYEKFSDVVKTRRYRIEQFYAYSATPQKARQFRVSSP